MTNVDTGHEFPAAGRAVVTFTCTHLPAPNRLGRAADLSAFLTLLSERGTHDCGRAVGRLITGAG